MSVRLVNVVIDAARPAEPARFWAELLGWPIAVEEPAEVDVRAPEADGFELDICFVPVPESKEVKNRVHLDLAGATPDHQADLVSRALALGASHVDVGQGAVPWVVLGDPEGNEFCVLEPREQYAGTGALAAIVVDARDPVALAGFWSDAIGWPVGNHQAGVYAGLRPPGGGPWLEFVRNEDVKRVKNRVHVDVAPRVGDDHAAEVARLIDIGAVPIDLGAELPWRVLADPEGNEFCVLTPR
jgi:predicted enzyme related to lactoylglutathione lyase